MSQLLLLASFYRQGSGGLEDCHLTKVTSLINGGVIRTQVF